MSEMPGPGAWLEPAFDLWQSAKRLVDLAGHVLLVAGVGLGLLYAGAYLERRALKGRLTVLDGVDAVREAAAQGEAAAERAEVSDGGRSS